MRKIFTTAKSCSRTVILGQSRGSIHFIFAFLLAFTLVACGDDSGTSANDGDGAPEQVRGDKEATMTSSSRHSGQDPESSSSSFKSSSSKRSEGDPSSSSQKVASSSSSATKAASSSSSVKAASSSSSVIPASSSSSSKKVESSSSEYVPYDHYTCLAWNWNIEKSVYKQFTDPRNGRSYYYYTAVSSKTGKKVTVMAENLNIGDMVLGEKDQNDDAKIERYCYNNDTTNCDKYGGLYQWAEMMQLPSRCNTESCSDYIRRKHQGICPEGWRLFTWDDYEIVKDYYDKYDEGITLGLRSQCFSGYNTSGFSLIGGGLRTAEGEFKKLTEYAAWFRPEEYENGNDVKAFSAIVSSLNDYAPSKDEDWDLKVKGFSVRCTKIE